MLSAATEAPLDLKWIFCSLTERMIGLWRAKVKAHRSETLAKIKLKSAGYRLVYEVRDKQVTVIVVAVGKRERDAVYLAAAKR